jgi:cobalt-zinc-cadmium efflux system protein
MGSTMVDPRSSPPAAPASDADQYSLLHIHKRGDAAHSHRRETSNASLLGLALAITFSFAIVEAIAGYLAGSLALLSDAAHMVTDAAALGLALFAQIISRRPPSARGHYAFLYATYGRWIDGGDCCCHWSCDECDCCGDIVA